MDVRTKILHRSDAAVRGARRRRHGAAGDRRRGRRAQAVAALSLPVEGGAARAACSSTSCRAGTRRAAPACARRRARIASTPSSTRPSSSSPPIPTARACSCARRSTGRPRCASCSTSARRAVARACSPTRSRRRRPTGAMRADVDAEAYVLQIIHLVVGTFATGIALQTPARRQRAQKRAVASTRAWSSELKRVARAPSCEE